MNILEMILALAMIPIVLIVYRVFFMVLKVIYDIFNIFR